MGTTITARRKPTLITLDTIQPEEMKWLWQPYIPLGTVTAMFGQGGQGKTFITTDIASRMSTGRGFPDSPAPGVPQKVLMLSAEDDYATVLVPRLIKQGANRANIAVPNHQFTLDAQGAADVAELMREFSATIVMIDPIVYYAGGKMDMNKSNEVRAMMEGLKTAAAASNSAVLIVGHVKKAEEGGDQNRMMGSADWVNAARSGILVTKTNDGTSIMKHVKTNYGMMGPSRAFTITDEGLVWGDTYADDDLPVPGRVTRKGSAIAFLRSVLADGPAPADEIYARAKDEEISPATLNRAKSGVADSYYSRSAGTFMWKLIDQEIPRHE